MDRGKRLRVLRQMSGLTIVEFADLCIVGESTIRQWEAGRGKGLSIKGAHKIVKAIKSCNLNCDAKWLLDGGGSSPEFTEGFYPKASEKVHEIYIDQQIENEIQYFCKHTDKPVFVRIEDVAMEPHFYSGDYVAGNLSFYDDMSILNNKICIITLANNRTIVRRVKFEKAKDNIKLFSTNEKMQSEYPVIINAKIISIALVSRVWRQSVVQ